MTQKSYTIDQVSWHTQVKGNPETKAHIDTRFRALFEFLARHDLLSEHAPILLAEGSLPEDTRLQSEHLTEVGLQTIKVGYDRWLSAIDKGTLPSKTTILESALRKVRGAQQGIQRDGFAAH